MNFRASTARQLDSSWFEDVRSLGIFGRAWAVAIVLFSAARALIAWPTFSRYGVNPFVFLTVDLVTAVPYGLAQAVTVMILRNRERPRTDAVLWAAIVVVCFFLPYAYIFVTSGSMPVIAYLGICAWIGLFGIIAFMRMRRQVRT